MIHFSSRSLSWCFSSSHPGADAFCPFLSERGDPCWPRLRVTASPLPLQEGHSFSWRAALQRERCSLLLQGCVALPKVCHAQAWQVLNLKSAYLHTNLQPCAAVFKKPSLALIQDPLGCHESFCRWGWLRNIEPLSALSHQSLPFQVSLVVIHLSSFISAR